MIDNIFKEFITSQYGFTVASVSSPYGIAADSSSVFIATLSNGNKLVLKKSDWYSGFAADPTKALEKVYEVAADLGEFGIPLQTALKNISGRYTTSLNQKQWVVLKFFEGAPFSGRKEEWGAAGKALGQFHKVGLEFLKTRPKEKNKIKELIPVEKPYEESRELYLKNGLRTLLSNSHECENKEVCDLVRKKIDVLDNAVRMIDGAFGRTTDLTEGILHNDFNYANGLYNKDGSFAGFLDIDQLGVGPLVWDIGNTLASLATKFLLKKPASEREETIRIFLFAYHQENPLPLSEYGLITASTLRWDVMRILRTLRRHYFENNRLPKLMSKIKERLLDRLEWAPEFFSFVTVDWLERNLK